MGVSADATTIANALVAVRVAESAPDPRLAEIGPDQWITRKGKKYVVMQIADIHPAHLVRIIQKLIAHRRAKLALDRTIVDVLADFPQWPALLEAGKRHGLHVVDDVYEIAIAAIITRKLRGR